MVILVVVFFRHFLGTKRITNELVDLFAQARRTCQSCMEMMWNQTLNLR